MLSEYNVVIELPAFVTRAHDGFNLYGELEVELRGPNTFLGNSLL